MVSIQGAEELAHSASGLGESLSKRVDARLPPLAPPLSHVAVPEGVPVLRGGGDLAESSVLEYRRQLHPTVR